MNDMRLFFTSLLLTLLAHTVISQEDPITTWEDKMGDPNIPLHEIQNDYEEYWLGTEPPKGSGHKPYKRWEYLAKTRANKEGYIDPLERQKEFYRYFGRELENNQKSITSTWIPLGPFEEPSGHNGIGRINVIAEHPTNSSTLFVGTPAGGLWKSTDGGTTWTTSTDFQTNLGVSDIAFDPANPSTMYIATGDRDHNDTSTFGILKSTDGGSTWTLTNFQPNQNGLPSFYLIHRMLIDPTDGNTMIVSTTNGVFRTTNGGSTWTNVLSSTCIRHMEFKPGDANIIYGTTSGSYCGGLHSVATYYRSTDNGASWTQITLPNTTDIERVAIGVSAADNAVVYMLASENDSNNSNDFFALYKSTDSGATVTEVNVTSEPSLGSQQWYDWSFAVSPTDINKLIGGGVGYRRSTNGGVTWTTGGSGVHVDHHFAKYFGSNLYLGTDGGIYKSTNDGVSWTDLSDGLAITQYYRISNAETDNSRMLAGSQDNGTHQLVGSTWQDEYGGDGMDNAIDPNDATNLFISWQYGHFLRSTNAGATFTSMIDDGTTGINGAWVTPIKIDPGNTSTIYVGYDRIWKSTNDGVTWTDPSGSALSGANLLQYIDVAPSNGNYIYVTDYSKIWRSTNGGTSWTQVGDPGSSIRWIEIDPQDETRLWACVNHKVYESTDSGASWTNISGTLPNIDMNTIVYDEGSNDALYVGTDLGVFYIDASMSDWAPFNTGLPNVIILELDILESDNKLRAATFGRGVWEADINAVPCSFDGVTDVGMVECDEVSGTYTRQLTIEYTGAPATGVLNVLGNNFPITGSPQQVFVAGLPLDGASVNVTAYFTADPDCTVTENNLFSNPSFCPCLLQDANLTVNPCDDNDSTVPVDDTFTFTINPTGSNTSTSYSVSGDVTANNLSYGAPVLFDNNGQGFLISLGDLNINITDDSDPSCTISNLLVEAPNDCSQNYICSDAWEISANGSYLTLGPNQGNGGSQSDGNGNPYHANWYYFTPASDGLIQVGSCGGGIDTRLIIHEGSCGSLNLLDINDDWCEMSAGSNLYASFLELCVEANVTYFIEWDNRWSTSPFNFDFTFISGVPSTPSIDTYPYSESFESANDTWVYSCDDDFNWTKNSGSTPSANTGPSAAFDGTEYIYLEASGNTSSFAYHTGPTFNLVGVSNPQISFYHHMYGSDMGTLKLQLSNDGGQSWSDIFSKSGNLGNQWNLENIDLSAYAGQIINLRFYGLTGSDFRSDMAIDMISVTGTSSPCPAVTDVNSVPIQDGTYEGVIVNSAGTVPANGSVLFNGESEVNLNSEFSVDEGGVFEINIAPCSTIQNSVEEKQE